MKILFPQQTAHSKFLYYWSEYYNNLEEHEPEPTVSLETGSAEGGAKTTLLAQKTANRISWFEKNGAFDTQKPDGYKSLNS